ncbi:MAG: class I SAM-dependent methyltransferase [Thermoleophilia bacterium]
MSSASVPPAVVRAAERAARRGFGLSCTPEVGALLAALAAAVEPGGRILELGTGAGVGLAWLVSGVGDRTDVRIESVELDPDLAADVAGDDWPAVVTLHTRDAVELLPGLGTFQLIFADAQGGKTDRLDLTLAALAPGGVLVVDDMRERPDDEMHVSLWPAISAVRERLVGDPALQVAELPDWASGVMLAVRRRGG